MNSSSSIGRPVREVATQRISGARGTRARDYLAAEEPLEIRVGNHSVAVVMRTPGEDHELAAGFLVTEGLVRALHDVVDIEHQPHCSWRAQNGQVRCSGARASRLHGRSVSVARRMSGSGRREDASTGSISTNRITVRLRNPESVDLSRLTRHVFSASSCGICSKATIDAVHQQFPPIEDQFEVETRLLLGLPAALSSAQQTFKRTGGLHACALFDLAGRLVVLREDVGRHNALDKVIGWALFQGCLPLRQHVLLLSGRASFELMQKALAAGIPFVAAISAPSSLAVEFARDSGQTLVGFLREDRMNVYAGGSRVRHSR